MQWGLANFIIESGFETCFAPSTVGAWAQNTSQIKICCAGLEKGSDDVTGSVRGNRGKHVCLGLGVDVIMLRSGVPTAAIAGPWLVSARAPCGVVCTGETGGGGGVEEDPRCWWLGAVITLRAVGVKGAIYNAGVIWPAVLTPPSQTVGLRSLALSGWCCTAEKIRCSRASETQL